jgi:prepilin-type N-terminal cleavage/methylation domain-containing protein
LSNAPARTRFSRRGLTLIEIMVAFAVMAGIAAVSVPTMNGLFSLKQRAAAKEIVQTYTWLLDEAALRNVAFRMVYNLDQRTWAVEAGDPNTMVFSDPEAREKFDEDLEDAMSRFTKREIEEGAAEDVLAKRGRFSGLEGLDVGFDVAKPLPDGTQFAFVYTPQYEEEGVTPTEGEPPEDEAEQVIAYTYVFPDGTAEHTVVRIVSDEDPDDGWTIEVLPISGDIRMSEDLIDPQESLAWIPEDGPEIR